MSAYRKRRITLNLWKLLLMEKARTWICITTLAFFTVLFLVSLKTGSPFPLPPPPPPRTQSTPQTSSSVFSWKWYLKWWFGPIWGVTQFSSVSPMYTRGLHVIKLLFVFPLLVCLLLQGGLSQEPRRVEGKLFFLSYNFYPEIIS